MHYPEEQLYEFLSSLGGPFVTNDLSLNFGRPLLSARDAGADTQLLRSFVLVAHKGKLDDISPALARACIGRSSVLFSNDVYVVFSVDDVEASIDDIRSYYMNSCGSGGSAGIAPSLQSPSRFCQYIGENTLMADTFFGRIIYLDSQDISLTPHIARNGRWEDWVTDFVVRTLRPGSVFYDIGANCGYFSLLAAHTVGEQGFVLAVEPQKRFADLVRRSISINGFDRFCSVADVAVGAEAGRARLSHDGDLMGNASLAMDFGSAKKAADEVEVLPLDAIVDDLSKTHGRDLFPDLIKVDVEGYEYFVWKGMKGILERARNLTMIMEFSPDRYRRIGQDPVEFLNEMARDFSLSILEKNGSETALSNLQDAVDAAGDSLADLILRKIH